MTDINDEKKPLAIGDKVYFRKLLPNDKSQRYLNWLNDPEVQKYSSRRGRTLTMDDIEKFLDYVNFTRDWHYAIVLKDSHLHIGNISISSFDERNKSAGFAMMLGDRQYRGQGYVIEALELIAKIAFEKLDLHRLWLEGIDPKINEAMKELNWTQEGVSREAFLIDDKYEDYIRWSLLKPEWQN